MASFKRNIQQQLSEEAFEILTRAFSHDINTRDLFFIFMIPAHKAQIE